MTTTIPTLTLDAARGPALHCAACDDGGDVSDPWNTPQMKILRAHTEAIGAAEWARKAARERAQDEYEAACKAAGEAFDLAMQPYKVPS